MCLGSPEGYCLKMEVGASLVVQWLRLHASTAGGMGSIPGRGTKIPHAAWHSHEKKEKDGSRHVKVDTLTGPLLHHLQCD